MFLLLLIAPKQKNFCVTKDRVPLRGWPRGQPRIVYLQKEVNFIMKLMETLGLESWDKLAEVANAPVSYRMTWIHLYLDHITPGEYSLEEWNAALKAVGCPNEKTPLAAKYALEDRMALKSV